MALHARSRGQQLSIAIGHEDEQTEADAIALDIEALHNKGGSAETSQSSCVAQRAYPKNPRRIGNLSIPVQPGGRTGLFEQPEAAISGATFAWLSGIDCARPFHQTQSNSSR